MTCLGFQSDRIYQAARQTIHLNLLGGIPQGANALTELFKPIGVFRQLAYNGRRALLVERVTDGRGTKTRRRLHVKWLAPHLSASASAEMHQSKISANRERVSHYPSCSPSTPMHPAHWVFLLAWEPIDSFRFFHPLTRVVGFPAIWCGL